MRCWTNATPSEIAVAQGYPPGESPDELQRIIGDLTVQLELAIKPRGGLRQGKTARRVELAHHLSRPTGPYPKSQVARALGLAHATP